MMDAIFGMMVEYGYYPSLILLKHLEDNERYEECAIVKKKLSIISNILGYGMSTDETSLSAIKSRIRREMGSRMPTDEMMDKYSKTMIRDYHTKKEKEWN